ncbi:deoxycytidine kinase-like [Paramacrobiotus metropolitanus]|uniref:deoxycytidine kinase-like n=1 Tax=Paramacrobiotus metropolitanus TaxID=2943436 RepID=UPI002445AE02|nr:deoxycytidine kinase-like [Paramacrobiotus metropolitanus]
MHFEMDLASARVYRFALEGGIGAGKTSLLHRIRELRPIWSIHEEPIERWGCWGPDGIDYLKQFYDNKFDSKNSRELQKVVIDSYAELYGSEPPGEIHIYERSPVSAAHIFSVVNSKMGYTSARDLQIIQDHCDAGIRSGHLKKMDAMIYLRTPPEICRKRRLARCALSADGGDGLDENANVLDLEYETRLFEAHEEYFNRDGTLSRGHASVMDETQEELSVEKKADSVIRFIESKLFLNGRPPASSSERSWTKEFSMSVKER